jgi:hypothetical protein
MDKVLRVETMLNKLNTLLSKAVYYKDTQAVDELNMLRRMLYYNDVDFNVFADKLKSAEEKLNVSQSKFFDDSNSAFCARPKKGWGRVHLHIAKLYSKVRTRG